jgi:hypothetical protein
MHFISNHLRISRTVTFSFTYKVVKLTASFRIILRQLQESIKKSADNQFFSKKADSVILFVCHQLQKWQREALK